MLLVFFHLLDIVAVQHHFDQVGVLPQEYKGQKGVFPLLYEDVTHMTCEGPLRHLGMSQSAQNAAMQSKVGRVIQNKKFHVALESYLKLQFCLSRVHTHTKIFPMFLDGVLWTDVKTSIMPTFNKKA